MDVLALAQVAREAREVGVPGLVAVRVTHLHHAAVAAVPAAEGDGAVGHGPHRGAGVRGVVDARMRPADAEDRVQAVQAVARADAAIVERRLQELAADRGSVGPVVAAAALLGLVVEGHVVVLGVGVAGGQDAARVHVGEVVGLGLVAHVHALVEHGELVAAPDRAGEVEIPGEDLGEVVGQLGLLAQLLDGVVEAAAHHAGHPRGLAHEVRLVAARDELPALVAQHVALEGGAHVVEAQDLALFVLHQPVAIARARVPEVEDGSHAAVDQVGHVAVDAVAGERAHQGLTAAELAVGHDLDADLGLRHGSGRCGRGLDRHDVLRRGHEVARLRAPRAGQHQHHQDHDPGGGDAAPDPKGVAIQERSSSGLNRAWRGCTHRTLFGDLRRGSFDPGETRTHRRNLSVAQPIGRPDGGIDPGDAGRMPGGPLPVDASCGAPPPPF